MFLECLTNVFILGLTSVLINKYLKNIYINQNHSNILKATNYLIASSVQFYILLLYIFGEESNLKSTSITITNIMFSYFVWDLIYINFVCKEMSSKILVGHHIISGLIVSIGTNYGENYSYIIRLSVASEVSNTWDNILFFLTTLNIIDERYKMYYVIRIVYVIHFGYDRLYNIPSTIMESLIVSNYYETIGVYSMAVIIIPFSLRLFLIKTKSLIKNIKKIKKIKKID
jgi:hypothetical protein